jgi:hypothetical protein
MDKMKTMANVCETFNLGTQASLSDWYDQSNGAGGVGGKTIHARGIYVFDVRKNSGKSTYFHHHLSLPKFIEQCKLLHLTFHLEPHGGVYKLVAYSPTATTSPYANGYNYGMGNLLTQMGFATPWASNKDTTYTITSQTFLERFIPPQPLFAGSGDDVNWVQLEMTWDASTKKVMLEMAFFQYSDKYEMSLLIDKELYDALKLPTTGVKVTDDGGYEIFVKPGLNNRYAAHVPGLYNKLPHYHQTRLQSTGAVDAFIQDPTTKLLYVMTKTTLIPLTSNAFVTCSLVDSQHVGNRDIPLMDVIPLAATYVGASAQAKQYVYEPKHIKYHPLSTPSHQSIQFAFEDEAGQPLPLVPSGVTTVNLTYKKI